MVYMLLTACLPSPKHKLLHYYDIHGSTCLPTQSSMVEMLVPLRVMHTVPFSGTQPVHVTIKQAATVCSQTPFKCYVPEKLEVMLAARPRKLVFQNGPDFQIRKTSLKWAAAHHQQTARSCVKPCIFVSRIPFQAFSGFMWILVYPVGVPSLLEKGCLLVPRHLVSLDPK